MKYQQNFPDTSNKKTALVAPLDWGLGHATRCIPIIRELMASGFEVIVAASGKPLDLLSREFPNLNFLTIDNYNIRYSKGRWGFSVKLLSQLLKILKTIKKERKWIDKVLKRQKVDIVISDNRPGIHHPSVFCIYMTHQLQIKTGNKISDWVANKAHLHYIKKFNTCWIPDLSTNGLSGSLGHPVARKINTQYINPVSRFTNITSTMQYDIAIILSGPEPQRTILEQLLMQQVEKSDKRIIVVRGLPDDKSVPGQSTTFVNHLSAHQLNEVICNAALVISRSGYTSIMDLVKLNKKAVLIPTPGQPEQEYLAQYLAEQKYFIFKSQEKFNLEEAWNEAQNFEHSCPKINFELYKKFIADLSKIKT